jgi:hypothetical protein
MRKYYARPQFRVQAVINGLGAFSFRKGNKIVTGYTKDSQGMKN